MANKIFPIIDKVISELSIEISQAQRKKIETIYINMISDPLYKSVSKISELSDIATKHFLDSLAPLAFNYDFLKKRHIKILDLGTGAGFPALPLSVVLEDASVVALDSRKKSAEFVTRIANKSCCKNIRAIHGRIEEFGQNFDFREKYDLVVCRALAEVRVLLEYCLPFTKIDGYVLLYKGPKLLTEIDSACTALTTFKIQKQDYSLSELKPPNFPFHRTFMLIHKKNEVPPKYPRRNGIPRSKPL